MIHVAINYQIMPLAINLDLNFIREEDARQLITEELITEVYITSVDDMQQRPEESNLIRAVRISLLAVSLQ
jgi:hypothetical protein